MVEPAALDAIKALRSRGVDNAEPLLKHATPDEIMAACRRWDARTGVGPGLLAKWIRDREFIAPNEPQAVSKADRLRRQFTEYAKRFPVGASIEPHANLQTEDENPCDGSMTVAGTAYPSLIVDCDTCGYEAAYTPRSLTRRRLVSSEDLF